MKFVDDFRDPALGKALAAQIAAAVEPGRSYHFMEFCGGHTHALSRFGLESLLPLEITMVHGPGCPVCVLPVGRLDMAIELALSNRDVILTTFGDLMRVPAHQGRTLFSAKADGADIRMIYSPTQALDMAEKNPDREVVFFAIGFETTTPPTAAVILEAEKRGITNFSVFCNHVLTPAAIDAIMTTGDDQSRARLGGFVGPGHVSTIIGSEPYAAPAKTWAKPIVISGFEPNDLLESILHLVEMTNAGDAQVYNAFSRGVRPGGNRTAIEMCERVFTLRESFEWRGLGEIPFSALQLAEPYADMDAEKRFGMTYIAHADHKACQCAQVLRGELHPRDCKVFAGACTPEHPLGSCMVSSEGACAAHYLFGRFRDQQTLEAAE